MKYQKIMCLVMLIAGALSAVYSLMFCTGALANFGASVTKREGQPVYNDLCVEGGKLYVEVQPYNNAMLIVGIVMILAAAVLYFCGTNKSRKYYAAQYVSSILVAVIDFAGAIFFMVVDGMFYGKFNKIMADPVQVNNYKQLAEADPAVDLVSSGGNFGLGFIIFSLVIVACVGLILNLVWKIKLMKGEERLLANSSAAQPAQEAEVTEVA